MRQALRDPRRLTQPLRRRILSRNRNWNWKILLSFSGFPLPFSAFPLLSSVPAPFFLLLRLFCVPALLRTLSFWRSAPQNRLPSPARLQFLPALPECFAAFWKSDRQLLLFSAPCPPAWRPVPFLPPSIPFSFSKSVCTFLHRH